MRVFFALVLALTAVAAVPQTQQRIVGGVTTTINTYPEVASLLYSWSTTGHTHVCGGTIITNRAILTAAHCTIGEIATRWRVRVGSANAISGGSLYSASLIINHLNYNSFSKENDIAIMRLANFLTFSNSIQQATISGPYYFLADNQAVSVVGWGSTTYGGPFSPQLRQVSIRTVNQNTCRALHAVSGATISDNMLCAGWLDSDGRGKCQGDFGGPLYHNRVVVGVSSWTVGCGEARFPGVSTRISSFTPWIQANA